MNTGSVKQKSNNFSFSQKRRSIYWFVGILRRLYAIWWCSDANSAAYGRTSDHPKNVILNTPHRVRVHKYIMFRFRCSMFHDINTPYVHTQHTAQQQQTLHMWHIASRITSKSSIYTYTIYMRVLRSATCLFHFEFFELAFACDVKRNGCVWRRCSCAHVIIIICIFLPTELSSCSFWAK